MKTRAFKKAISFVCVLAMLMSLCTVLFIGSANAASEVYTFHVNGEKYTKSIATGAELPAPDRNTFGAAFEGWYDSGLTTKNTTAGATKELYAKFNATILTFDENCIFDPNNNLYKSVMSRFSVVDDPVEAGNKVLKANMDGGNKNNMNVGLASVAGTNSGLDLEIGKYYVTLRYYVPDGSSATIQFGGSARAGLGTTGNKCGSYGAVDIAATNGVWKTLSYTINVNTKTIAASGAAAPYVMFQAYDPKGKSIVYIDDITITKYEEHEYTLHNNGTVTTITAKPGTNFPNTTASLVGWYNKELNIFFDKIPAYCYDLYAVYDGVSIDFNTLGYYDPNEKIGTAGNFEVTSEDGNKYAAVTIAAGSSAEIAPTRVPGLGYGLKLKDGNKYSVRFQYKSSAAVDASILSSDDAGISTATGTKTAPIAVDSLAATDTWTYVNKVITLSSFTGDNSVLKFDAANGADFAIDNIVIKPYVEKVDVPDFVMDFDNDFKWSVADANKYTVSTGNGYVNRGEIVTEDTNGMFRVKHFRQINAYLYFTVNDGAKQFELKNGGLYKLSFKYKVEHSETPTEIGILYAKPTTASTGLSYQKFGLIDSFEYRDDSDWTTVEYYFSATLPSDATNSLGIYLYNTTRVPEEYATSVLFDDVVVSTYSLSGEDGLLVYDSLGGDDNFEPVAVEAGIAAGTLPVTTKEFYSFEGWLCNIDGVDEPVNFTANSIVSSGVTMLYANWKLHSDCVELKFKCNVDSFDKQNIVLVARPGEAVKGIPTVPEVGGQEFEGWYLDSGFTKPLDASSAPSESSTVYAKWKSSGDLIDFSQYAPSVISTTVSPRFKITPESGSDNISLIYDFENGGTADTNTRYRAPLYDDKGYRSIYEDVEYTIKFKYKVMRGSGTLSFLSCAKNNTWSNYAEQGKYITWDEQTKGKWIEGTYTFTAVLKPGVGADNCTLNIGVGGAGRCIIDDVLIIGADNVMNIYGSAIRFTTNGGDPLNTISGDPGETIKLPTPVRSGYKFVGWYTDPQLKEKFTDTVYGTEDLRLYAAWVLGKFNEGFEEFPTAAKSLGVSGAYTFYNSKVSGFDKANVKAGDTSLFRNGATTGVKTFTICRNADLALTPGLTYTISFYVKPTSLGDQNGTISLYEMSTYAGISTGNIKGVMKKVSDLKEGVWQQVTYTFVASTQYIGISTTDSNDMYFDDFTLTLAGYTGSSTGDSSISPVAVLAIVILSLAAFAFTAKKVYSK